MWGYVCVCRRLILLILCERRFCFETSDWSLRELRENGKPHPPSPVRIELRLLAAFMYVRRPNSSTQWVITALDFLSLLSPPSIAETHPTDDHRATARSRSLQVAAARDRGSVFGPLCLGGTPPLGTWAPTHWNKWPSCSYI